MSAWIADPLLSIRHFVKELKRFLWLLYHVFEDRPGEIYAVRNVSPLVAAYTHSGAMIASDLYCPDRLYKRIFCSA